MKTLEPTLKERAGRMYRRLLVLQRVFQPSREGDVEWPATDDGGGDAALSAAIREVLDELTEHARILTSIPFPISEWQPGDGPDDQRWRSLTEIERREVLSMIAGYDQLISWSEEVTQDQVELAGLVALGTGDPLGAAHGTLPRSVRVPRDAAEFLKAERARIERIRHDLRFLEKRLDTRS
jgi:hypothetical protein